jgi:hypothetical protein
MSGSVLRQVASHEFFLGAEPGAGPRAARREKRLVRFVHPSGMTSHELILLRQKELDSMSIRPARSTADEFGLRPPKLHTPREKAGTLRDPTYLDRRRRVLDLNQGRQIFDLSPYPHVESILSTRPSGVPIFGEADAEEYNTNAPRYPHVCAAALVCPATPCCLRRTLPLQSGVGREIRPCPDAPHFCIPRLLWRPPCRRFVQPKCPLKPWQTTGASRIRYVARSILTAMKRSCRKRRSFVYGYSI